MALWFFNKVVWFVLAAMLEGIFLPSKMAAKTTFCLYLVERLIVTLRFAVNVTTSSFQQFSWSLGAKFLFSYELTHFKKMVRVWKTKSLLFCLSLIVFWRQNHNFHFHKYDITWPLSPNGLFDILKSPVTNLYPGSYAVMNWTLIPSFCRVRSRNEDVWRCVITFGKDCLLKKIKKIFQLEGELLPRYRLLPNPTVFLLTVWIAKSYFSVHRNYLRVPLTIDR